MSNERDKVNLWRRVAAWLIAIVGVAVITVGREWLSGTWIDLAVSMVMVAGGMWIAIAGWRLQSPRQ